VSEIELPNDFKRDLVCDIAATVSTPNYSVPLHEHFIACGDECGNICVWRAVDLK